MHRYLLTFAHSLPNGGTDMTALDYATPRPITCADDIQRITTNLHRQGYDKPFIVAFSLFADPAPNPQAAS